MLFLFSLIPATGLAVVGYFVLFTSKWAEGGLKRFGKYLGAWIFVLAGATVLSGLFISVVGMPGPMGVIGRELEKMEHHMERMEALQDEQLTILRERQRD